MADPFDLQRFVSAQNARGTFATALSELRAGAKRSHWMWFVFPQLAGLGRSATAQQFALAGREEAGAYLDHPVLGPRLHECVDALLALPAGADIDGVLGGIDALKLRSSMTLFAAVAHGDGRYDAVLQRWYGGEPDDATLRLLGD